MDLRAEVFGGLMWLDRESTRLFEKNFVSASGGSAEANSGSDRVSGEGGEGRCAVGGVFQSVPRVDGGRIFFEQDGRGGPAVFRKSGGGGVEGLRSEGLGDY